MTIGCLKRPLFANAFFDSVPFLAVTGNVPTSQFNRGAFQETYRHYQADFPSTVRAYCKRVFQPTRGDMVPLAVRQAWRTPEASLAPLRSAVLPPTS